MAGRGQYTRPVVVVAFEGWNDAADAATAVVEHLAETYPTEIVFEIDSDDYYDYQIVRPRVVETDDGREVVWPSASVRVAHLPERDVLLVSGPEPNLHWQRFCSTLVSAFRSFEPEMVILLGAMLTDSPHSRPLPVTGNTSDTGLAKSLGLEPSGYEGPTGITGVLGDACHRAGLREVSLWASVPHYVAAPPNPKATLALLARLEDLLDVALRLDDLPELARAWQRGVDELAAEDTEISEYIESLEAQQDETGLPQATGDSIAREFERYLRRRGTDGPGPQS
ncbi:filament polymerization regulator ParJ [Brooklawnia propionicigenes]|jgi:predicted ATP-grasp superfamily ATP-dependent carboligase|uniref:Filament polymerization regulator ParJ n=2 Tax=root TaxID=1 RepID=A0AAN0KJY3_9ACTN|nr:PAC2 family protein [Brooklawnia sp. SH051]MEA5120388.1 PAC2 family protein [Propionibacterium sp.]BEH03615.1 filament polymerization regulator ParJ [Brooklawnia sp. SH051]